MNAKQIPLIALFGCDGSGKSTCIELLDSYLKKQKTCKVWLCSHHLLAWILCRIFVSLGYYVERPSPKKSQVKYPLPELSRGTIGRYVWQYLEFISVILMILVKIKINIMLGYTVIVERYIPGTLADFTYMFGGHFLNTFAARFLLRVIEKNALLIYLNTDYKVIVKRRGISAEPWDYVETQMKVYTWFFRHYPCHKIDTSQPLAETTRQLLNIIDGEFTSIAHLLYS